jgi:hypothetical protein
VKLEFEDIALDAAAHATDALVLRSFVSERAVQGHATGTLVATLRPGVAAARVQGEAHVRGGHVRIGGVELLAPQLDVRGTHADGRIQADFRGRTASGNIAGRVEVGAAGGAARSRIDWQMSDLNLASIFPQDSERSREPVSGRLDGDGWLQWDQARLMESLTGEVKVSARDARLIHLPVLSDVVSLLKPKLPILGGDLRDRASASLRVSRGAVEVVDGQVHSPLLTAFVRGRVHFDRRLELIVSLTPAIGARSVLGRIGAVFDRAVSQTVEYDVRGTTGRPEIRVRGPDSLRWLLP